MDNSAKIKELAQQIIKLLEPSTQAAPAGSPTSSPAAPTKPAAAPDAPSAPTVSISLREKIRKAGDLVDLLKPQITNQAANVQSAIAGLVLNLNTMANTTRLEEVYGQNQQAQSAREFIAEFEKSEEALSTLSSLASVLLEIHFASADAAPSSVIEGNLEDVGTKDMEGTVGGGR